MSLPNEPHSIIEKEDIIMKNSMNEKHHFIEMQCTKLAK